MTYSDPVFIGKRWTLEVRGDSGYVTCAISANTKAYNDPEYPETDLIVPRQIEQRIKKMMRAHIRADKPAYAALMKL